MHLPGSHTTVAILTLVAMTFAGSLSAASSATNSVPAANTSTSLQVVVTARKWSEPLQNVPGAVTVVAAAGAKDLRDAVRSVPNLTLADFTVRSLTFPYVRGIGSGQNAPAVATYIDGVPQCSYVTASQELLDVERIEILRGPQGAMYGSASMGGVINIVPHIPTPTPGGYLTLSAGDHHMIGARGGVEGPLDVDGLLGSFSGSYASRDGYTHNDYLGHDVDSREDWAGRAQLYLPHLGDWDFRLSVTTERDHDGGYALYDLASIRARPFHVAHDYEGYNDRDIVQPVFTARFQGDNIDFTSITAFQWWQTRSKTDGDYSPADLMRISDRAISHAWIQELRFATPSDVPVLLSDRVTMHWLAGAFAFDSRAESVKVTDYRPLGVFYTLWPAAFQQEDSAAMENIGVGFFGQTTFTLDKVWELGLGLRDDFERRAADLRSRIPSPGPILSSSSPEKSFNQLSPRATLSYNLTPDLMAYVQAAEGYKAGGFNREGPVSYAPETSWNYETGLKSAWFDHRLTANVAIFRTVWRDMQLNVPVGVGSTYCIENTGRARSQGAEIELRARPSHAWELFANGALLDGDFRAGATTMTATPSGFVPLDIGGNDLPFAPRATWNAGAIYTQDLTAHLRGFVTAEVSGTSRIVFDPSNGASQGALALVNLRAGVDAGHWRVEAWVKNLFGRDYVALAMPYPGLAPSGYIGENGAPRTLGLSLTRTF